MPYIARILLSRGSHSCVSFGHLSQGSHSSIRLLSISGSDLAMGCVSANEAPIQMPVVSVWLQCLVCYVTLGEL